LVAFVWMDAALFIKPAIFEGFVQLFFNLVDVYLV
jgi:hypothetical protein